MEPGVSSLPILRIYRRIYEGGDAEVNLPPLDPTMVKLGVIGLVVGLGLLLLTYLAEYFVPLLLVAVIGSIAWKVLHG